MIFKDKMDFVSPAFKSADESLLVTIASKGIVDLEVMDEDSTWRSFPETLLVGPTIKTVLVPANTPLRFSFSTLNTVTAHEATLVEVVTLPVEEPTPEVPPVVIPPVEEPTPVDPEPEVPVDPTPTPVEYDYVTTGLNDYNSEYWSNGVWIYSARAGINIPATTANVAAFVPKAVVNFNVDGAQKEVTEVQVVGANISVWFDGAKLLPVVGYPGTVSVKVVKQTTPTTPTNPSPSSKVAGPSWGINFASGTFSDNVIAKLPGTYDKDYTYPNAATFSRWKARGAKHVRLPIRWERIQHTMNAPLDSVEAARLLAVYDLAAANDMVICLDLHNYMQRAVNGVKYDIGTTQVPQAAYNDVWVRLVGLVGSHKASYGYGIMNEPMGTNGRWSGIAQSVVDAIRAVDAETYIFICGDQWATPLNWVAANPGFPLKGKNLVYEAHLYVDKNAGGGYADANEQIDPQTGIKRLMPYRNWGIEHGAELVLGEIGWPAAHPSAIVAIDNVLKFAAEEGIRSFGWMGGDWLPSTNILAMELDGQPQSQVALLKKYNTPIITHGPYV